MNDHNWWCHFTKVERLDDNVEDTIWWLEDYFEVLLMMLYYDILLHYYWIHDAIPSWFCWVLSWWHRCPTWWHYDPMIDKLNKGEAKQWKRHVVLFTSCTQKLKTVTKKKCFYHLGGILSTWVLYHLVEYIFPVLMSLYLPRNSQRLMR